MKNRKEAEDALWKSTYKNYKGLWKGQRSVLHLTDRGATIVPIADLTDDELRKKLGKGWQEATDTPLGAWINEARAALRGHNPKGV